MYRKYVYQEVTWFDFREISKSEAIEVCSLYGLAEKVIKLILNTSVRHGVVRFDNCVLASMELPCTINTKNKKKIEKKPIHFVIGEGFLITVRFDEVRGLKDSKKSLEVSSTHAVRSTLVFAYILTRIYEHINHDLADRLPLIAAGHNSYAYKKYLIDYNRTLIKHEQVLEALRAVAVRFFTDPELDENLEKIMNKYRITIKHLDEQRYVHVDCLDSAREQQTTESYLRRLLRSLLLQK